MSLHAAKGAEEDLTQFRAEIDGVSASLTELSSAEEIAAALDKFNSVLERHNRGASGLVKMLAQEVQRWFR